jgi:hypothetical protein
MRLFKIGETSCHLSLRGYLPGPHLGNIVFGGQTPALSQHTLSDMGFGGILYSNAALQSAMFAIGHTMKHLKSLGSPYGAESQTDPHFLSAKKSSTWPVGQQSRSATHHMGIFRANDSCGT